MPFPAVLVVIVAFAVGAVAGRWVEGAVEAIPAGRPWAGRPWCRRVRLPLAGPLLVRRCPTCGAPIPAALPLTEASTGVLFALVTIRRGAAPAALVDAVRDGFFMALLLTIARIDWRHHLIFDCLLGWGRLGAFGYAALSPHPHVLVWAVGAAVGAGCFFLGLYLLALVAYRRRALGFGDVPLAALIGAMTGSDMPVALFTGMILAAMGGVVLLILRRRQREYLPYGSFLCAGALITLLLRRT